MPLRSAEPMACPWQMAMASASAVSSGFFGGAAFGFVPSAVAKLVQMHVFMRGTGVAAD